MDSDIRAAIVDLTPAYHEVTTYDLQGLCDARALEILTAHSAGKEVTLSRDFVAIGKISDLILDGIYHATEKTSC